MKEIRIANPDFFVYLYTIKRKLTNFYNYDSHDNSNH